jgi:hypothetical protein
LLTISYFPLYRSTDALLEEREINNKALANASAELESKTAALLAAETVIEAFNKREIELKSLLESLQLNLDASQRKIEELEKKETQHEATNVLLKAAQADASSAAGQLVDACEENAKLSEAVGMLQGELEERDVKVAQLRQENSQLVAALQQQQRQLPLPSGEQEKFSPLKNKSLSASRRVQVAVQTHNNPAFESPGSVHSSDRDIINNNSRGAVRAAAVAAADHDDLLAIEISRLRLHTEDLEMQLAESKNAAPVLAALEKESGVLRKENAALRIQADHAALQAADAQRELNQVQLEARVLHGQLSEVISSLAEAGLATSPISLLQFSEQQRQQQQLLILPSSSSSVGVVEEDEEQAGILEGTKSPRISSVQIEGTPLLLEPQSAASAAAVWSRGPPTPTWQTPPQVASSGGGGGGGINRPGSDSTTSGGGGSDLILAELRSAMAQLDSVTAADGGIEPPFHVEEQNFKKTAPPTATAAAPAAALPTATDILESISRGIAALGGGDINGKQHQPMYLATSSMSSAEGAATVTPRA